MWGERERERERKAEGWRGVVLQVVREEIYSGYEAIDSWERTAGYKDRFEGMRSFVSATYDD